MSKAIHLALMALLIPAYSALAADIRPVLRKIEKSLSPDNVRADYQFKNFRTDGTISEYTTRIQARSVHLQHVSFIAPDREKGREVLRNDEQMWTYVPSVGRVIKIEDRDSFAGGDFSNADILRVDWTSQYEPTVAKESDKQWIVELKAKGKSATYSMMRLWIKKDGAQPVQQEFYDSNGTLLKRLRYGSVKSFGSVTRPSFMIMDNVITGQKSELKVISLDAGQKIPESRFIMDNLGK